MDAQNLIRELGRHLGFSLDLSADGTCRVLFGEDAVDFEAKNHLLYLMADLGADPGRSDIYERLLAANHLGSETNGAAIGLDRDRRSFSLSIALDEAVDYAAFEAALVRFVKALRYWKEWLAAAQSNPAPETGYRTVSPMEFVGLRP